MAMTELKTRISLKYDKYSEWVSKNPVLLAGEVAIATIPSGTNVSTGADTTMQNLPNVVFKVGDGETEYVRLPFVSALAADVYGWAKTPEKPKYNAAEIEGLEGYIAGQIQDTDTQYTIQPVANSTYKFELMKKNKGEADTSFTHVTYIDLSEIDTRLDALAEKVGDSSVTDQIADVVDGFNLTKLESTSGSGKVLSFIQQENGLVTAGMRDLVAADIPTLTTAKISDLGTALNAKQDNLTFTSDYAASTSTIPTKKYTDELVANTININNNDKVVAGQFVTAAVQENGEVSVSRRALQASDFANNVVPEAAVNGLTNKLNNKQETIVWADGYEYNATSNKAATVDYVASTVAGLNGAMHFIGKVTGTSFEQAVANLTPKAGDVVLYGYDEYVYDAANKTWVLLGNESIYQTKDQATIDHNEIKNLIAAKQDPISFEGTYNKDTNKAVTVNAMAEAIASAINLDYNDTEVAGKFVSAVKQEDGQIEVTRRGLVAADFTDGLIKQSAVIGLSDSLSAATNNGTQAAAQALNDAKSYTDTQIGAAIADLDHTDTAVAGQFVTKVGMEDGKLSITRSTVDAKYLTQTTGEYLILNCGTASTVI